MSITTKTADIIFRAQTKEAQAGINAVNAALGGTAEQLGKVSRASTDVAVKQQDAIKGIKRMFGEESAFGNIMKMAVGGGALAGVGMFTRSIESVTSKLVELKAAYSSGAIGAAELTDEIIKSLPFIGSLATAIDNVLVLIGAQAADKYGKQLRGLGQGLYDNLRLLMAPEGLERDLLAVAQKYEAAMARVQAAFDAGPQTESDKAILAQNMQYLEQSRALETEAIQRKNQAAKEAAETAIEAARAASQWSYYNEVLGKALDAQAEAAKKWQATLDAAFQARQERISRFVDAVKTPLDRFKDQLEELQTALKEGLATDVYEKNVKRLVDELRRAEEAKAKVVETAWGGIEGGVLESFSRIAGAAATFVPSTEKLTAEQIAELNRIETDALNEGRRQHEDMMKQGRELIETIRGWGKGLVAVFGE